MTWIEAYLRYTSIQESPTTFHFWSAVFALASSMKRNISFDRGFYVLFPNFYIGIIAPTAIISKSTASDIAVKMWTDSVPNATLMREKMTPWAVYDWLTIATGKTGEGCLSIYAPEMRTFISASYKEEVITMLTSLYTCPNNAPYITKGGGTAVIKNVCLNVLACSTPEWLMTGLTGSDIGGGFTGRWIYVYRDKTSRSCACPEDTITPEWQALGTKLAIDLHDISTLKGQFKFTSDSKQMYESWYRTRKKEWTDERLFGYYGRKRDTVLKLAMILSVVEPDFSNFYLTTTHLKKAFRVLSELETHMGQAFSGVTFSESTKFLDRVLKQIHREHGANKRKVKFSKLARMNQHYVNAAELEVVLESLIKMDHIDHGTNSKGKKVYWPI